MYSTTDACLFVIALIVALKRIQPTAACIYINLQPIIASVVAILIGQDIFSWDEPLAALLVISGVLFVSHSRNTKPD
ncbi:EamA family transporter [Parabacteroides hominis]|uniref:EamA family transporter n=1 Tax=Parabacteroides hominis TaxID=2763057 RepID=UPI0026118A67|nr:EamA family transporter [uncultured Parabacteroides sp.]